ncbi:hypothetical protein BH18ACT15_BH18ACT15_14040 [soil metagenome]
MGMADRRVIRLDDGPVASNGSMGRLGDGSGSHLSYDTGYGLGVSWAQHRGTPREVKHVAAYVNSVWFELTFTRGHSLMEYLAEELWDCDPPGSRVRLMRDSFSEGLVAGVSTVSHKEASAFAANRVVG